MPRAYLSHWTAGALEPEHGPRAGIAAMGFTGGRCPVRQLTFVTYSESENPDSRHAADYTRAFSRKRWEHEPFCASDVRPEAQSIKRVSAR